jgi:hypothetical protein
MLSKVEMQGAKKTRKEGGGWKCFATGRNGRRRLTRKPPLFLLSPGRRWKRGAGVGLCDGQSDIAALAEGIQVLYAAQEGGRRRVDGRVCLSPAPAERVHRVAERSGGHVWQLDHEVLVVRCVDEV